MPRLACLSRRETTCSCPRRRSPRPRAAFTSFQKPVEQCLRAKERREGSVARVGVLPFLAPNRGRRDRGRPLRGILRVGGVLASSLTDRRFSAQVLKFGVVVFCL